MDVKKITTLRQYLTVLHNKVKKLASLEFEYHWHPDNPDRPGESRLLKQSYAKRSESYRQWEEIRSALLAISENTMQLEHWHRLPGAKSFCLPGTAGFPGVKLGPDPYCISLGRLKHMADKARRKHPEIKFLQGKKWIESTYTPAEVN